MNATAHPKHAASPHPVLAPILQRWSPRAFDQDRPVTETEMLTLLDAARWAPSANNLQPWRLAWGLRGEPGFAAILGCLNPGNAGWAGRAGALLIGCTVLARPDGTPSRHAAHDLGQALAIMAVQGAAMGLGVHQMGGFNVEAARIALAVPAGTEPYTAVAIGWPGDAGHLSEAHAAQEAAPRSRHPLSHIAPRGGWR